jgi:hypothetical protein
VSLAKLRDDGIISSEEFDTKKAELLSLALNVLFWYPPSSINRLHADGPSRGSGHTVGLPQTRWASRGLGILVLLLFDSRLI